LYGLKDAGTYRQSRIANRRLLGREGFAISSAGLRCREAAT
jgi:hypothetical protein